MPVAEEIEVRPVRLMMKAPDHDALRIAAAEQRMSMAAFAEKAVLEALKRRKENR